MAAQSYISISELHPNFSHPKVVGIVIGKTDVRSFPDRKNANVERFTFGFTVRDSPDFFINVSAWGNEPFICGLADSFGIGDRVIIENPLVSTKDLEKGDRFCPATPSHYRLLVTETHSQVSLCSDVDDVDRLLPLIHLPVKNPADFYSLADIVANGQKLDGSVINILAALKVIGETKQFVTSDGRRGQRLEVKLFDDSIPSFPLISWDRETIQVLQNLAARETVLFIADAKMSFDSFRSSMVATVNSKSIITVNPETSPDDDLEPFGDTREASLLFSYAKEMSESGALDQDEPTEDPPVESITEAFTVQRLKDKAGRHTEPLFGLIYGFVSKLDLDSSVTKVIRTRCARCRFLLAADEQSCTNQLCPGGQQPPSASAGFDLLVDLTDHTGTLQAAGLRGRVAEQTLGCTAEEFTWLTDDQRTALKWRFLLERSKVYLKILPSARMKSGMRAEILGCSLADPGEVKQHMSALLEEV